MEYLYGNIGKKIMGLAIVSAILGAVVTFVLGIAIAVNSNGGVMLFLGIFMVVAGPICSWVGSWVLYGFGKLVDNSQATRTNVYRIVQNTQK